MDPFFSIVLFIVAGPVFIIAHYHYRERKVSRIWGEVAERVGGQLYTNMDASKYVGVRKDRIEAKIGEYDVTLSVRVVSQGKSSTEYLRATVETPSFYSMRVYREGMLSGLGKMVGFQDIQIGYADFDGRFVIKSEDVTWTKLVFARHPDLRQAHFQMPEVTLDVQTGSVCIERVSLVWDTDYLERFMRLAAMYAHAVHHTEMPMLSAEDAAGRLSLADTRGPEGALSLSNAPEGAISSAQPPNDWETS